MINIISLYDKFRVYISILTSFKETVVMSKKLDLLGTKESQDGYKLEGVNSKERNYTLNKIDDRIKRIDEQLEKYFKEMDEIDKKESLEETITITEEMIEEKRKKEEEKRAKKEAKKKQKQKLEEIRKEMEEKGQRQKSLTDSEARLMKNNGKYTVGYNVQEITDTKSHIVTNYEANNNPADIGSMSRVASEAKEIMGIKEGVIDNITDQGYKDRKDMAECLKKGIRPQVTLGEEEKYEIEFEYKEKEISEEKRKSQEEKDIKECLEAGVIPEVYEDILSEVEIKEKKVVESEEEIRSGEKIEKEDIRAMAIEKGIFIKDKESNKVFCPQGETLRPKSRNENGVKYCNKMACKGCKKPCTLSKFKELIMKQDDIVSIPKEKKEAKELKKKYNPEVKKKKKKVTVVKMKLIPKEEDLKLRMRTSEHVHGTLKRTDDASYLLLKGTEKVNGELALSYSAINLRRIINIVGVEKILEYLEEKMRTKNGSLMKYS